MSDLKKISIELSGIVQGIGFRPWVYRTAKNLNLSGWVLNQRTGVYIEIQGESVQIDLFLKVLFTESNNTDGARPPATRIDKSSIQELKPERQQSIDFQIRESTVTRSHETNDHLSHPPVDLAPCLECKIDLLNAADRRFEYPFTNCMHCGPRYSIIKELPYDRIHTTMSDFLLCDLCKQEYTNVNDRRFHAEPIACSRCGPQLSNSTEQCVEQLKNGKIIAMKGVAGYQLLCDAENEAAVLRLRQRKNREAKPFALLVESLEQAKTLCKIDKKAEAFFTSGANPIVLFKKNENHPAGLRLAPSVAPGFSRLGISLPSSPLHLLLIKKFGHALVCTSGNLSNAPIESDNLHACEKLSGICDYFLHHNRIINMKCDDSVFEWDAEQGPLAVRIARGFSPLVLPLPLKESGAALFQPVLAMGADLKASITLTLPGDQAVTSQYLGDLEDLACVDDLKHTLNYFLTLYSIQPKRIACDAHPQYRSHSLALDYAKNWGVTCIEVQHHFAHFAAVLAEHQIPTTECLGIILDGTGFGADGTLWGGEILLGNAAGFKRIGHLRPFSILASDTSTKAPWKTALGLLKSAQTQSTDSENLDFLFQHLNEKISVFSENSNSDFETLNTVYEKKILTLQTSSCGRLFDAIAALCGCSSFGISYEGQAAIEFEHQAGVSSQVPLLLNEPHYSLPLISPIDSLVLDWWPLLMELQDDLKKGLPIQSISRKFHLGLAIGFSHALMEYRKSNAIQRVVLSGGCFANAALRSTLIHLCEQEGIEVLLPKKLPFNDGGIAFGQAAVATYSRTEQLPFENCEELYHVPGHSHETHSH